MRKAINKSKNSSDISVIIPSFNGKKHVLRLVYSLYAASYKNLEIIIVDNGSIDGTIEALKKRFPTTIVVDAGKKNIGLTGCRNLGISVARRSSKYFALMDADTVAEENMLLDLVEFMEDHPNCGISTPMILYLSNKKWVNQAGSYVNLFTGKVKVGWGSIKNFQKSIQIQNSGTVLFIDRKVIDVIGGFDDELFMCYEDVDFCLRAKNAGFEIWYCSIAIAYHDQSLDENVWRPRILGRAYALGRNRTLTLKKYSPFFPIYLFFIPIFIAYYAKEALKYRKVEQISQFIKGNFDGLRFSLRRGNYVKLNSYKYEII